jgi:hypothetical protein
MQIKFLTIYFIAENIEISRSIAQEDLLRQWQESLRLCNIKTINKATIKFTDYALSEYPEQDRLKKKIDGSLKKHYNYLTNKQYWWFLENRYEDFDIFYADLAKTHQLMELVITVEDY